MDNTFSNLVKKSIQDEEDRIANNTQNKTSKTDWNKLRRKVKTNFFVGFGCGLIVSAAILFIFKPEETVVLDDEQVLEMQKEDIIKEAKVLGMVFPEDK